MGLVRAPEPEQELARVPAQGTAPAQERGRESAQEPVRVQGAVVAAVREEEAAYGSGAGQFCFPRGSHWHRYHPNGPLPVRERGWQQQKATAV